MLDSYLQSKTVGFVEHLCLDESAELNPFQRNLQSEIMVCMKSKINWGMGS